MRTVILKLSEKDLSHIRAHVTVRLSRSKEAIFLQLSLS